MDVETILQSLMAGTENERRYALGPSVDNGYTADFPVDEAAVREYLEEIASQGRLASIRFRQYEFGLIKSALGL